MRYLGALVPCSNGCPMLIVDSGFFFIESSVRCSVNFLPQPKIFSESQSYVTVNAEVVHIFLIPTKSRPNDVIK